MKPLVDGWIVIVNRVDISEAIDWGWILPNILHSDCDGSLKLLKQQVTFFFKENKPKAEKSKQRIYSRLCKELLLLLCDV